MKIQVSR